MKRIAFTLGILNVALAGLVYAQEKWVLDDLLKPKWVGPPALSPDGRWVAYPVYEALTGPEQSEFRTHIHLSHVDGSVHRQITRGNKSCFAPAWSPDQKQLAFLSSRDLEYVNIWLIDPTGGEARRLTNAKSDIQTLRWSPNSRKIAYLMADTSTEEEKQAKKAKDDPMVVDSNYRYVHLYTNTLPIDNRQQSESFRVTIGEFSVDSFDWSPDGTHFVISHFPTPRVLDWRNSDLSTIAAEGGELKPLVIHDGMDMGARFSPDGKTIAFISDRGNRSWARHWRICLIPTKGGTVTVLPPTFDEMPGEDLKAGLVGWAVDGSGIYYTELERTDVQLFFMPVDGSDYRRVTTMPGAKWGFDWNPHHSLFSFEADTFTEPPEIYVQSHSGEARQVTKVNAALPKRSFTRSEVIQWRSFDNLVIEGILHYPLDYRVGRRYPLLVELHGGPTWAFLKSFTVNSFNLTQILASEGFALLQVNPRGSAGYGKKFRFANLGDWGGKDVRDVLAGVDHLIETGLADPERLGVFGWSYGGFLTSMTISRTRRFRAAVIGAGITNLISFAGTTDIIGFVPSFMESEPWQKPDIWSDHSAVFHAGEITTATLFLYGEKDVRVPPSQGYELYRALQRTGVETQMVVYPRTDHFNWEPKLSLDVADRLIEWFKIHL